MKVKQNNYLTDKPGTREAETQGQNGQRMFSMGRVHQQIRKSLKFFLRRGERGPLGLVYFLKSNSSVSL
jgi:hypothetical protein